MPDPLKISDEEVTMWRNRLIRAERSKKHLAGKNGVWSKITHMYQNQQVLDGRTGNTGEVNLMFANIRQIVATLYFKNPTMYAKGMTRRGKAIGLLIANSVLPLERRIMKAEKAERHAIQNACMYGTGILKHGFNAEYSTYTAYASKPAQDLEEGPEDAREEISGVYTEHNSTVREGHPWVKSIDPWDFGCDPECDDFTEARWMYHWFRRSWKDCVEDGRYDKAARAELRPSGQSTWFSRDDVALEREEEGMTDASMVTLCEIFDRVTGRIIVLSDTSKKALMAYRYHEGPEGTGPYAFLKLYDMKHSPWGLPLAMMFMSQCAAINELRVKMKDHLERFGFSKFFYNKNRLDPSDVKKLRTARSDSYTPLIGDDDPKLSVYEIPPSPINPDVYNQVAQYQSDMDQVSGINENARGANSGGTATEASIVAAQGGVRTEDMLAQVIMFLRESTQKTVKTLRAFWGPERVYPEFSRDGEVIKYFIIDALDVNSEYEIDIEPGSTQKYDSATRMRQVSEVIDRLVSIEPMLNMQGVSINWPDLAKRYVQASDLYGSTENILVPMAPPQPQPGNVVPFGQQAAPGPVDQFGQAYAANPGFQSGRQLSEARS